MAKTCKYYKRQKFVSYNDGETWQPLDEFARGALIETDSPDCGAITTYRWYPSGYTCIGYDKWNQAIRQVSYDNGENWSNVQPEQYTATTLEETNSFECGFIPPNAKFAAKYDGGEVYSAECDSSTELVSGETRPSGYTYSAMTAAIIGDCVTEIGDEAFHRCFNLSSVIIPSSVITIGDFAFAFDYSRKTSLKSIEIPDSVTSIGIWVFNYSTGLTSVTLSNSLTQISDGLFDECHNLSTINSNVAGVFNLPPNITSIGKWAFLMNNPTSVIIPSGVTVIGASAFMGCDSLTGVTCLAITPPTMIYDDYYDTYGQFAVTNSCPIYVPAASVNAYKSAIGWSEYADRIQAIS